MSANETTIANLALGKIGSKRILSLDDASPEARACKLHYDTVRDEVLRSHRWNFAIRRQTLTALTEVPLFGWSVQYQLPVDCLRVLQLNGYEETEQAGLWEVEGGKILTDEDEAQLKYIARITDGGLFDSIFITALAVKLASVIAKPLTGSSSMSQDLISEYERITGPKARRADAFENRIKRKFQWVGSDLVNARFTG
jgi:hypothetical protein